MIRVMIGALASHLWQSTGFALAAAVLALALRRNRAQVRYALWLCASLKFLLPFGILVELGRRLSLASSTPFAALPPLPAVAARIGQPWVSPAVWTETVALQPAPASHALLFATLTIWAAGVAAIAMWRLRAWRRLRALVRASQPLALAGLTLPRGVEARSVEGGFEPGVIGWLRPKLLLPAGIARHLAPEQLGAVLAHELCHIRRRDNLAAALHMLVEALFWFHPLVWWIGARLVAERERACDEDVLRRGSEPADYAHGILNVCRRLVESPAPWAAGVSGGDLTARIEAILAGRLAARLSPAWKAVLAAAGLAALAAPIAAGMLPQTAPAPAPKLHFEVASVRELGPGPVLKSHYTAGVQVTPGRVTVQCDSLNGLIHFAYNPPLFPEVAGLPRWGNAPCGAASFADTFQIEATMPVGTTEEEVRHMMQSLLADRFKLAVHWETVQGKIYALRVIPGATLKPGNPAVDNKPPKPHSIGCGDRDLHCQIICCGDSTMAEFASNLGNIDNRPVMDKTGLTGEYFTQMIWAGEFSVNSPLPSLAAALKEKGLELRPETGPILRLVIDHVEKPSAN